MLLLSSWGSFIVSSAHSWWERGDSFQKQPLTHYSSCLISAIFSPSSSLKIFSCPLFSVKELPRPSSTVLPSPTTLLLTTSLQSASPCVSQPLWKRQLLKILKNILIGSTQKNTCWRDDQGGSVSSLGTLWHHWTLPPLHLNCIVRIFARKRHDDKSFLTSVLLLLVMNVLEILLAGCFSF